MLFLKVSCLMGKNVLVIGPKRCKLYEERKDRENGEKLGWKNEMLMWKYKEMRGRREEIKGDVKRGITLMF